MGETVAVRRAGASWASRAGRTSPEELLAAAHAACFAMALSHAIAEMGGEPAQLEVEAAAWREAAERAERLCPVSNALRGDVGVRLAVRDA